MKRPWLVWALVLVHALFAAGCITGGWFIWKEAGQPNIIGQGRDTLRGLYMGLGACVVCGLVYAVVAVGLWKKWRWSWWLGVATNGLLGGTTLLDLVTDSRVDLEDLWVGLCFVALIVFLLLPTVRQFIFRRESKMIMADGAPA